MAEEVIAPRTDRLDMIVVLGEVELRSLERLAHALEPAQEGFSIGHHEADPAAQVLWRSGDQVELAAPDIDPHIVDAGHHVGIARQPDAADIEQRRQALVLDLQVHMLERHDVAEVLGAAVIGLAHVLPPPVTHDARGAWAS